MLHVVLAYAVYRRERMRCGNPECKEHGDIAMILRETEQAFIHECTECGWGAAVRRTSTKDLMEKERKNMSLDNLITKVLTWHYDRNLIKGSTDRSQFDKLDEEVGELLCSIINEDDVKDDIGDIMVVLINIAERNNTTIQECLEVAYEDIKDRKGKMVDGIFVKE